MAATSMNDITRAPRSPWVGFSAVAVGTFMSTLDGSIVNVALPSIGRLLGASIGGVEWVVSAYLLVISSALLAVGRLGDLVGHRRVFTGGMLLFTAGSGLCGLSRTLPELVASRAIQALGAAAMMAIGPAAVTAVFSPERRGRALGGIASVVAAGLTAGPPLGGFILAHFSWRAIFFVNLPVGVCGAFWASRALPGGSEAPRTRFDAQGAVWFTILLASVLGAIRLAPELHGGSLWLMGVGLAAAALLVRAERRAHSPLLLGSLFRSPIFTWGLVAGLLSYGAMFSQVLLTPFYLAQVKGLAARDLGIMLTAVPLALSIVSPVSGRLSDRFGSRWLCLAGTGALAVALASLAVAGADDGLPSFAARLALAGAGMGLFQAPNNSAVMGTLPRDRLGSGSGMLATSRNLGMVLGVALAGTLFASRAGPARGTDAFLAGFRVALSAGAALAIAAGILSLVRGTGTGVPYARQRKSLTDPGVDHRASGA
jgi:EmrB/QacA subfamily drug resistance transporter